MIFGERRPISAGDVFLIKGQTRHGYENLHDLALCNLLFDLHEVNNPLFALCRYPVLRSLFLLEPGFSSRRRGLHLTAEELPGVLEILSKIEEEQNGREEDFASAMSSWLVLLTVKLSRLYGSGRDHAQERPFELYRLINEISDRSQEEWSRERMAKLAGMSVSTLTRQFRKATGYPPNEYLLMLRLKKSLLLLVNPELSISDVADRGIFRQQLFLPSVQASLRSSSAEVSENAAVRRGGSYSSLYLDRSGSWNSPNSVTEVLSQLIPLRMSFAGVPAISEFCS